jgi:hypothetical protein
MQPGSQASLRSFFTAVFKTIDIFEKSAAVGQAKQMVKTGMPSPHALDSLFHLSNEQRL